MTSPSDREVDQQPTDRCSTKRTRRYSVDQKSRDLAEYFLGDDRPEETYRDLAQSIQDCVEDFCGALENAETKAWERGGDLNGTSRQGTLHEPYARIVEVLGEPGEGDGHKVCFEWVLTFQDGTVASIYDYKASTVYDSEGWKPSEIREGKFTEWSIGGRSQHAADLVKELFR